MTLSDAARSVCAKSLNADGASLPLWPTKVELLDRRQVYHSLAGQRCCKRKPRRGNLGYS